MRTYVQAELTPLHDGVNRLSCDVASVNNRVGRLESQFDSGGGSARPEPHDPARRVVFLGFGAQILLDERTSAMDNFMQMHFPNIRPSCVDLFLNKTGQASVNVFNKLCSSQQARMLTEGVRTRNLILNDHAAV